MAKRTIRSLQLRIEAAESGMPGALLPDAAIRSGHSYPLPDEYDDLVRVSKVKPGPGRLDKYSYRRYIHRAKEEVKRVKALKGAKDLDGIADRARREVNAQQALVKSEVSEAMKELERFRKLYAQVNADLASLHSEVKKGYALMMRAFNGDEDAREIIGSTPTIDQFIAMSRIITSHVEKLGAGELVPDDVKTAKAAVFRTVAEAALAQAKKDGETIQ